MQRPTPTRTRSYIAPAASPLRQETPAFAGWARRPDSKSARQLIPIAA